jgi:hypothetical protein
MVSKLEKSREDFIERFLEFLDGLSPDDDIEEFVSSIFHELKSNAEFHGLDALDNIDYYIDVYEPQLTSIYLVDNNNCGDGGYFASFDVYTKISVERSD